MFKDFTQKVLYDMEDLHLVHQNVSSFDVFKFLLLNVVEMPPMFFEINCISNIGV